MTSPNKNADSILRQEAVGFILLIVISWAAEGLQVPQRLFGDPGNFNWQRAALRSVVVILIWVWVHLATKRLLKRLHQLEEFLLVCSWCRKVGHEGKWLTMEDYFGSKFSTETSHGICPDCAKMTMDRIPIPPDSDTGTEKK